MYARIRALENFFQWIPPTEWRIYKPIKLVIRLPESKPGVKYYKNGVPRFFKKLRQLKKIDENNE